MNATQIALVRESWARVAPIAPTAAHLFYVRLFMVAPGVRSLFPDDLTRLKRGLMLMLEAVVSTVDDLDALAPTVRALGRRHAAYGARPEHYSVFGDCLLWTLGRGLGATFTAEVEEAWATAYSIVAAAMVEAHDEPMVG